MDLKPSPFAPTQLPMMSTIRGIEMGVAQTGVKYKNRDDLLLMTWPQQAVVSGVFTKSQTAAAPVQWCRERLKALPKALIVNAGNANAFTGKEGWSACEKLADAVADATGCRAEDVLIASTGVIGQPLRIDELIQAFPSVDRVNQQDWLAAANAIRTTDTYAKVATEKATIGGVEVTINGIAKGSGMIAPNMATMLGFIATDAAIGKDALDVLLQECNQVSFNSITVDGDTSTNDTVLLIATGEAGNIAADYAYAPELQDFKNALQSLMTNLAQQIVKDGEGASKFVTIQVSGTERYEEAHAIAMTIANSPITKAAIAGEDPNWGRVVMAAGNAGVLFDQSEVSVAFGDTMIARDGAVIPGYDETPVVEYMKGREIAITVEVGKGSAMATAWTCDFTHGYIEINADYRS